MTPRQELLLAALERAGVVEYRELSMSMSPAIPAGSVVRVQVAGRPRPGDVVLVTDGQGRLLLHRLVHVSGRRVVTSSDYLGRRDPATTEEHVHGVAVAVRTPEGRWTSPPPRPRGSWRRRLRTRLSSLLHRVRAPARAT